MREGKYKNFFGIQFASIFWWINVIVYYVIIYGIEESERVLISVQNITMTKGISTFCCSNFSTRSRCSQFAHKLMKKTIGQSSLVCCNIFVSEACTFAALVSWRHQTQEEGRTLTSIISFPRMLRMTSYFVHDITESAIYSSLLCLETVFWKLIWVTLLLS